MRRWVVLAFLLVACSQTTGSPVAGATASPAQSAATPIPDLPLTNVDLSCRLPVIDSSNSGIDPPLFAGGFVTFPAAALAPDSAGGVRLGSNGDLTTEASPTLHNDRSALRGTPFYDRAQRRWVPASPSQSTPDGAFYAYATWDPSTPSRARVHIVNVGTATEKVFDVAVPDNAMGFTVADFDSQGVYLLANAFEQLPSGVWLMDATSGALRELVQVTFVEAVRGGYAWAARIDPRDPSPPQLRRSGTSSNSVVRVDLATGAKTTWFYRPGLQVDTIGFDSRSRPIIQVSHPDGSGRSETWLVNDPGGDGSSLIYAGGLFIWEPQADGDRLWFGGGTSFRGTTGIYLYTQTHGLQKVFAFTQGKPDHVITPVGFCA
ncbi:MAG: hypothetical protein AUJ02_03900 [Chloroflexi bacterium 13_1_40CM_3_65_12]|nr:MAG: hypothetical protein AUJ02_03900 [Chloroflexi bacterium 13_1_40CM_3_65_12]OLD50317.1 MAG: hypothetical protein AUI42_03785 [Actinobacteria bacterium 13_1_40CM_2_65_8]